MERRALSMEGELRQSAEHLMALFEGHGAAHGTHGEPVQDGLKWVIKTTARTLREPVTVELWEQHLRGERPLGVIPIREDSTCSWGSIDLDVYDADLLSIVSRVREAGMPLVPCRSKSGGLHLFLFLTQPQPAVGVRSYLRDLAARLGIAKRANGVTDIEIFPVQSQVLTERRDVGNWMVMPYFGGTYGGRLREQAGLKATGAEQTIPEFLAAAEAARLTPEDLARLSAERPPARSPTRTGRRVGNGHAPPDQPFGDGPPCLEHLAAEPMTDGRKRALFMMGLYFKRADPSSWRRRLEEANATMFNPPLPADEVTGVTRSLQRKEYEYTCQTEPMASHCDSHRCRMRKFGVGKGGVWPCITGLSKLDTDPPIWFLDVDDIRVEATTAELLDYKSMMRLFAAKGNRVFRLMKQSDWVDALIAPMENLVVLEAPPDAGISGRFLEVLEDFLVNRWRGQSKEDLLRGKPWEDTTEQRHYFRLRDLQALLMREGVRELSRGQIVRHIQQLGGLHSQFQIKGHCVSCYWVPSDTVSAAPELDVPEPKGEVI